MQHKRTPSIVTMIAALACVAQAAPLCAQGIEVAPFGGYRFGGDFFQIIAGHPVDADGAPALGVAVDAPLSNGLQFEGLFTHQQADLAVAQPFGPPVRRHMSIEHWQGGGLQEFDVGHEQVRSFLTGTVGLTRFAAEGDSEIRFSVAAGGGVKLFPSPHVGVRLDGRLFATFVDGSANTLACVNGTCLFGLNLDVVWQAEFTTAIVVKFH